MSEKPDAQLLALQKKELELKIENLEIAVNQSRKPEHKKISFWISTTTVVLALGGIIGQNILSNIKAESAKLDLQIVNSQTKQIAKTKEKYTKEVKQLELKAANLRKTVDKTTESFGDLMKIMAYGSFFNSRTQEEQNVILKANDEVSGLLEGNEILLKNSILKIYYTEGNEIKAKEINKLLLTKGAKSTYSKPEYDITGVRNNRLVYYNKPQKNYCEAVQLLLKNAGYGDFEIQLSSQANSTTSFFKIYLVK